MDSLPLFMNLKDRPVILLGEGEAAEAKARLLARAGAVILRDETADARLAIITIADKAQARAVAERLRARGVLVNATDRPELCDFTLPAIVDRSPVLVAIGTGGASASLAKAIRQWLEQALPSSLGALALALRAARPRLARQFPGPAGRRAFLDDLLGPGGPLDPLADHAAPATTIDAALEAGQVAKGGMDEIVLTGPDPDALTLRQARLLARADRIYHQPAVPSAILARARADAPRISCSAPPADNQEAGRILFVKMADI